MPWGYFSCLYSDHPGYWDKPSDNGCRTDCVVAKYSAVWWDIWTLYNPSSAQFIWQGTWGQADEFTYVWFIFLLFLSVTQSNSPTTQKIDCGIPFTFQSLRYVPLTIKRKHSRHWRQLFIIIIIIITVKIIVIYFLLLISHQNIPLYTDCYYLQYINPNPLSDAQPKADSTHLIKVGWTCWFWWDRPTI